MTLTHLLVLLLVGAVVGFTKPDFKRYASTSSPLTSASNWPSISTQGESCCPLFFIISA